MKAMKVIVILILALNVSLSFDMLPKLKLVDLRYRQICSKTLHVSPTTSSPDQKRRLLTTTITKLASSMLISTFLLSLFPTSSLSDDIDAGRDLRSLQVVEDASAAPSQTTSETKKSIVQTIKQRLSPLYNSPKVVTEDDVDLAREKVLTLQAYLNELERDLFSQNWNNVQIFITTLSEQDETFSLLANNLFTTNDPPDVAVREAMTFEGQTIFYALDDLREAVRSRDFAAAQKSYARLLLSYDHFLKAGDLYPEYDPLVSTEVFFARIPRETLRFDTESPVNVQDHAVLMSGPDMGRACTVIYIDEEFAVVKLDYDGRSYQEVKSVEYDTLAKTDPPPLRRTRSNGNSKI